MVAITHDKKELSERDICIMFITRANRIREAAFGYDHPKVAIRVNSLRNVLHAIGAHVGARAAFERVFRVFERMLGPSYPSTRTVLNNMIGLPN